VINFAESVVEDAALAWFSGLGYTYLHGPDIAAGEAEAERNDPTYHDVILENRFRQALARLNPDLFSDALDDAYRKLTRVSASTLVERNSAFTLFGDWVGSLGGFKCPNANS
jgi:type I restriction enzyme R subunit